MNSIKMNILCHPDVSCTLFFGRISIINEILRENFLRRLPQKDRPFLIWEINKK